MATRTQPRPWLRPATDLTVLAEPIDRVTLVGSTAEAKVRVTAAPLRAAMTGPAQLTLEVPDPERRLITDGRLLDRDEDQMLDDNIDVEIGSVWWRLMGLQPSENGWTVALEDRSGAWLRRHSKPMRAVRGRVNRAAFIRRLYQQAGGGIDLFVPELLDKQRQAKSESPTRAATADPAQTSRLPNRGWPARARPTVKRVRADDQQLRAIVDILTECARLNCSRRVTIATIMCATQESVMRPLGHGDAAGPDSRGFFQQRAPWGPESVRRTATGSCRLFLTGGRGGQKGWKQRHGSLRNAAGNLDRMITQVQISVGGYKDWEQEATRTVDLWLNGGGGGGAPEGTSRESDSAPKDKAYAFERSADGKREDSLACAQRLADEVGWRHWVFGNTGVYASDFELLTAPAALRIRRGDRAVVDPPKWKWDVRRPTAEFGCEVIVTQLPEPGQVAIVEGEGSASGRYLVSTVECDLAAPVDLAGGGLGLRCRLTFTRPQKRKPEPAPESSGSTTSTGTDQGTKRAASDGGKLKRTGNKVTGGTARERIVFAAKESARLHAAGQRKSYYLRGGTFTVSKGITGESGPPVRSDCSQWVLAMFWSAGLPAPDGGNYRSGYTGSLIAKCDRVTSPLPGDLCFYGTGTMHHVELYVGDGKTIGHGSAPVDYATPRGIAGFAGYYRPRVLKGRN